jgi:hypothetical protein
MHKLTTTLYYHKGLKVRIPKDFAEYYYTLTKAGTYNCLALGQPLYAPHVSITLPNIHGMDIVKKSKKYAGEKVTLEYSGDIIEGGTWFTNFWMIFNCDRLAQIKKELGIKEKNFLGFHLTIANDKNNLKNQYPNEMNAVDKRFKDRKITKQQFREEMKLITGKK